MGSGEWGVGSGEGGGGRDGMSSQRKNVPERM